MNQQERGGLGRRALALVGVAALALIGTAGIGSAAFAADELPAVPAPSISNITGTMGSLTIHKHSGDPGAAGDGSVITDPAKITALGAGLVGVDFNVQRVAKSGVPIDLTTAAGWDAAQLVTPGNVMAAPYSFSSTTSVTTGAGGVVTVPDLPYGLYYVTETDPGDNSVVSQVAPFLVSIPYPVASDSSWLYNVHVYPKNKLNTTVPTKTVSGPTAPVLGSTVTWTVTAPIQALGAGDTYRSFVISDLLDPRLELTGIVVKIDGDVIGVDPVTGYTPSGAGQTVIVTLNTDARMDLVAGENVTVEYTTKVVSLGDNGLIDNTGLVYVNDTTKETDHPRTNWGPLTITKKAAQEPNRTLQGAEFTLHETKGGPVVGTYTTNSSGQIVIDGLYVGSGTDVTQDYWLHETKAPAGYALPLGDAAWTMVTVDAAGASDPTMLTINNTQQNGPNLPLTGSSGTTMFMLGGLALLLAAGGMALVASSRRRQDTFK